MINFIQKIKKLINKEKFSDIDKPFHPQNQIWINNFWKSKHEKCKYLGSYKTSYENVDVYFCPIMKKIYTIHTDHISDFNPNEIFFKEKNIQTKINHILLLL